MTKVTIELSTDDAAALMALLEDSPHEDGCTDQSNPELCINCRVWNRANSALDRYSFDGRADLRHHRAGHHVSP